MNEDTNKVKRLNHDDLNQKIAAWLGNPDWHPLNGYVIAKDYPMCADCDLILPEHVENNPDYTRSATACLTLIEAVRAKGHNVKAYANSPETGAESGRRYEVTIWRRDLTYIEAGAETLPMAVAQAVVRLVESEGK